MTTARRGKGRGMRSVVGLATSASLVISMSATAGANHGDIGAPSLGENPDNTTQDVESIDLTVGGALAVSHARAQLDRSDIKTSVGTDDIHVRDGVGTLGWFGLTRCTDINWWNWRCNHYDVDFNTLYLNSGAELNDADKAAWKYTGCHEFGHTGGLGHRMDGGSWSDSDKNSCMNIETRNLTNFDDHDIIEINEDV